MSNLRTEGLPLWLLALVSIVLFAFFCWIYSRLASRTTERSPERETPLKRAEKLDPTPPTQYDLYKLVYEKGIERYENIYRAIWQNFSYMGVLAGVIVTFGSKQLHVVVIAWLALSPLAFWYLATFLPMDFYGQQARVNLGELEDRLAGLNENLPELRHYSDFAKIRYRWRVGEAVKVFGFLVCLGWTFTFVFSAGRLADRYLLKAPQPGAGSLVADSVTVNVRSIAHDSLWVSMQRLSRQVQALNALSTQVNDLKVLVDRQTRVHENRVPPTDTLSRKQGTP